MDRTSMLSWGTCTEHTKSLRGALQAPYFPRTVLSWAHAWQSQKRDSTTGFLGLQVTPGRNEGERTASRYLLLRTFALA